MRHQDAIEAKLDPTPVDITKLKPSELLALALDDLEWVEAHPHYVVEMGVWHEPADPALDNVPQGTCLVCLAGSVLAHTLKHSPDNEWSNFANLSEEENAIIDRRIYALNEFRRGWIDAALEFMHIDLPDNLPLTAPATHYEESPAQFKSDMRDIVKLLQDHDL